MKKTIIIAQAAALGCAFALGMVFMYVILWGDVFSKAIEAIDRMAK